MDWILVAAITGGVLWLASQALRRPTSHRTHCARCGGPLELDHEGMELLRQGLSTSLPAVCTACGSPGTLTLGLRSDDPWLG